MGNPFLEEKSRFDELSTELHGLYDEQFTLTQEIKNVQLEMGELSVVCTHVDENNQSTVEYESYDSGEQTRKYQCTLCKKYGKHSEFGTF